MDGKILGSGLRALVSSGDAKAVDGAMKQRLARVGARAAKSAEPGKAAEADAVKPVEAAPKPTYTDRLAAGLHADIGAAAAQGERSKRKLARLSSARNIVENEAKNANGTLSPLQAARIIALKTDPKIVAATGVGLGAVGVAATLPPAKVQAGRATAGPHRPMPAILPPATAASGEPGTGVAAPAG